MTIIYELDASEFSRLFDQYNRSENFTITARYALFEYYDNLSDDTGKPIKLCIISLCCEWSEYTPEKLLQAYGYMIDDCIYNKPEALVEHLGDLTTVIKLDNDNYLIQDF